jgi:hypothetical protein
MKLPLALAALVTLAAAGRTAEPASAPALNWVVHVFSDKEGYRVLTARGAEARAQTTDSVLVTNLSITVYTGDATAQVETVFLSPLATFSARTNRASGDQSVGVVRDDLEGTPNKRD